ncbi:hypothetical protein GCM10022223_58950 [Kineosporia mesophila]|uniref:Homeodomain-like domain-containing protein n=1 Tax=Kineosporia mesophila TaxID=566012 RepID=A0ABP7AHM3_9ACTN|nr:HTH domain-containing protein [Kineosporia mesophila]MCD5350745.1 helix-turn-helix domain-containing protein [Kineosporia mesophila]
MIENTNQRTRVEGSQRAWPVLLLALPAFVAIWSGWVELGRLTGFGEVKPLPGIWDTLTIDTAITLPIGVETYAAYALNVWLAGGTSDRATRFARASALGSLALGAAGQVAYHLMSAAGMVSAPWQITAVVACLPVAVLGMGAALHHLVTETAEVTEGPAVVGPSVEGDDQGDAAGPDDAEVWTERAVIVNAVRERHPSWPADAVAEIAEALAPTGHLPTPAPRTVPADDQGDTVAARKPRTSVRATAGRKSVGTATKVHELRAKHPEWTVEKIASRVGVTDRTVRRHLNTAPAEISAETSIDLPATGEPSDLAA